MGRARRLVRRAGREEHGVVLVVALGVLIALSLTMVSAVDFSAANGRSADYSEAAQKAFALAEAGLNNAAAVLNNPDNNARVQTTLPATEAQAAAQSYRDGTAYWWGVFDGATRWEVCGVGAVRNPTGVGLPQVKRRVCATVVVTSALTQRLNNQAWNYIFAKDTGSECDMWLVNNARIDASVYVNGNLCMDNSAQIVEAPGDDRTLLVVRGKLKLLRSDNSVGVAATKIAEAHVANGCTWRGNPLHNPCSSADNVWADRITSSPTEIVAPDADFEWWYANAAPGPLHPCTESYGTAPNFDNDGLRNRSAGTFDLTPNRSYTCRVRDGSGELVGELSWNHTTRQLTVLGAIYFDGNMIVGDNALNDYGGMATLYLSGTFSMGQAAELCGGVGADGHCDFNTWNPNSEMLAVISDGEDALGRSILLTQSARFQGALYATNAIRLANSTEVDGPMIAGTFTLDNWSGSHTFPRIDTVPLGFPGNPNVYAQPNAPAEYTG